MASVSIKRPRPCQNDIDDDLATSNFVFSGNDTFPRFLVIQSQDGSNPVTSLSPFIIEKQIESLIGTPKSVAIEMYIYKSWQPTHVKKERFKPNRTTTLNNHLILCLKAMMALHDFSLSSQWRSKRSRLFLLLS